MYDRTVRFISKLTIVASLAFVYYLLHQAGIAIPCIFLKQTGLKCPGCGITRMLVALIHGEFEKAFYYNAFTLTILPFMIGYFTYKSIKYLKTGNVEYQKAEEIFFIILAAVAIVFAIIRNTSIYPLY